MRLCIEVYDATDNGTQNCTSASATADILFHSCWHDRPGITGLESGFPGLGGQPHEG